MFTGCGTALVTPFHDDGSLDEGTLRALIARQIAAGIHFLVPCGTTGESPTLRRDEHLRVVQIVVAEAQGKVPVLAGAGGYNTVEVIALARDLEALGADGILSVTPYYNKPAQEGLYRHYAAIAEQLSIPLVVYSVQGRTGVNVEPATLERLAGIQGIFGVKEASGNINQIGAILKRVPATFTVLSGDDSLTLPILALGGRGVVSVLSNLLPAEMVRLTAACLDGNFDLGRTLQREYLDWMDLCFVESNPIPVKAAMAAAGLLLPVWRLPLTPPQPENQRRIEERVAQTSSLARGSEHAIR